MKIKYLLSVIAIVAFTKDSFAQYAQDAVRFSTFQTGSTSRIKAIGNAGTAIGGDLSSVSGNPAGLGFFTHSEISVTPEYDGSKVKSNYFGQANSVNNNNGNLANAAVVLYQQLTKARGTDKNKGWLSLNYGAAYARTNNFYENVNYTGKNNSSSIADYYASQANQNVANGGSLSTNGLDGWGYDNFLIDNYGTTTNPNYKSNVLPGETQSSITNRSGGQSELDLSFGANYSNKLYIGLGLAMTDIRYNSYTQFGEVGTASILQSGVPANVGFNSTFAQDQQTTGSGFNAKLGIIYKPVEALRLGFVFTTPTYYNIDDSYSEQLNTAYNNGNNILSGPNNYPLSYTMRTPLKLAGGAAYFIGRYGFISGDVEYVDYSTTHLNTNEDYSGDFDNAQIKENYRSVLNVHVGAEARLNSVVYLRGGYGLQGDPLKDGGSNVTSLSGGLGFRFGSYYVDATYVHLSSSPTVSPYQIGALTPTASLNKSNNNGFLTLGYAF